MIRQVDRGPAVPERLGAAATPQDTKILIEGGWVANGTEVPELLDVFIVGSRIAQIGRNLRAGISAHDAVIVDAHDHLVMPGFIDAHLHAWEGQLRGFAPAATFDQYVGIVHQRIGPAYRPEDIYTGTRITDLQCINAGVTGIIDNFHNHRSPAHADAAVDAHLGSGLRVVLASGEPLFGDFAEWLPDVRRLRQERFAGDDSLVSLRFFGSQAGDPGLFRIAREDDMSISTEMGSWVPSVPELAALGLLSSRVTFNHCTDLSDEVWNLISDSGVTTNVCPRSDSQFGLAVGEPPVDSARRHGVFPGVSMDNELAYRLDMFEELRYLLLTQRSAANIGIREGRDAPAVLLAGEALSMATAGSASNAGWDQTVGQLRVGFEADIVLLDCSTFKSSPVNNLYAQAVNFASPDEVDAVFIAGRLRKWGRELVGVDIDRVTDEAERSVEYLLDSAGIERDIYAAQRQLMVDREGSSSEINDIVQTVKGL